MKYKSKLIQILYHTATALGLLSIVAFAIYGWHIGIFSSVDALKAFVQKAGSWGGILFVFLQIFQVVIPIIPGGITLPVGVLVFGGLWGFIYNYVGICIGSVIVFLISRKLGPVFMHSITSKRLYDKYIGWLDKGKRFERLFAFAIFLPISPDDFLCILAGLTKMSLKKFILIILIFKPFTILAYSIGLTAILSWVGTFFA